MSRTRRLGEKPQTTLEHWWLSKLRLREWGAGMPHAFSVFLADSAQEQSALTLGGWKREHLIGEIGWSPVISPQLGLWLSGLKRWWKQNTSEHSAQPSPCVAVELFLDF
eukprot:454221-Amphidinium_carterae.2